MDLSKQSAAASSEGSAQSIPHPVSHQDLQQASSTHPRQLSLQPVVQPPIQLPVLTEPPTDSLAKAPEREVSPASQVTNRPLTDNRLPNQVKVAEVAETEPHQPELTQDDSTGAKGGRPRGRPTKETTQQLTAVCERARELVRQTAVSVGWTYETLAKLVSKELLSSSKKSNENTFNIYQMKKKHLREMGEDGDPADSAIVAQQYKADRDGNEDFEEDIETFMEYYEMAQEVGTVEQRKNRFRKISKALAKEVSVLFEYVVVNLTGFKYHSATSIAFKKASI